MARIFKCKTLSLSRKIVVAIERNNENTHTQQWDRVPPQNDGGIQICLFFCCRRRIDK
jgi:hypothetical protein